MQEILLNILILSLLILVFGVIQRRRISPRIRYWTIGWLFILFHFAALLVFHDVFWRQISRSTGLLLAGASFLIAVTDQLQPIRRALLSYAMLAGPSIAYLVLSASGFKLSPVLVAVALVGQLCILYLLLHYVSLDSKMLRGMMLLILVVLIWLGYEAYVGYPKSGIFALLSEMLILNAWFYWREARHPSVGFKAVVLGFLGWSAVFPGVLLMARLLPAVQLNDEIWNIPKYLIAFGMILILLEEEILAANHTSEDYRLLFDNNPSPMWIYDLETLLFLRVNEAAQRIYGYSEEEFRSMRLADLYPVDASYRLPEDPSHGISEMTLTGPWTHIHKDSSRSKVEMGVHTIEFEGRKARFCLILDVTERERLHKQLLYQAHHDLLTGLPNRLLLKDRMQQAITRANRNGRQVAFICIDLDRFKQINDSFGHMVGDECLRQIADRLNRRLRAEDTVARSGGEEFMAVLGDLKSRQDLSRIAEDLLHVFRDPMEIDGLQFSAPASIGIALYPEDGMQAHDLWRSADLAMYRSKKAGGNRYTFVSDEINSEADEAKDLEAFLRTAPQRDGLELYYQPQYNDKGVICGLEALLRLHHEKYGLVMPERFIPIAEESGLILPIGSWVLREVARQAAEWASMGLPRLRIALNVSPLQFMHSDFYTYVQKMLQDSGIPTEMLELELTETTVMRNVQEIARQMRELAMLGVRFSVDDFGTGYSSLRHLHQLPLHALKIDSSFVERIMEPNGTYTIVQAIISLAHSLGMQVVAEGVETEEQFQCLKLLRCDIFQGYYFGYPVPAQYVPQLLRGLNSPPELKA